MLYKVIDTEDGFDVYTEDGGIAKIRQEDRWITSYYQDRVGEMPDLWMAMSHGRIHTKVWEGEPTRAEMVQDALEWLVMFEGDFQEGEF